MAEFTTTESLEITLTIAARKNLENMQKRVWDIENQYGTTSDEALRATWSFLHALMQLLRFGGEVYAEDDLSLIIDSYITLGVIFHPVRKMGEDGTMEVDPLLGEWSVHS